VSIVYDSVRLYFKHLC